MSMPSTINGDLSVNGQISSKTIVLPAGTVNNTAVAAGSAGAFIAATKLTHRVMLHHQVESTADGAAGTWIVHATKGAATAISVTAMMVTKQTGDKTITVDVKKSTGGGAAESMLNSVITLSSASTNLTPATTTFSSTAIAAGDILEIVVAVTGSTGDQGKGLAVTLMIDEEPST
jgi:hypothetical protein